MSTHSSKSANSSGGSGGNVAPPWANPSRVPSTQTEEVMTRGGGGGGGVDGDDGTEDMNNFLMAPVSTLDEPVMETIMRDVRAVASKLRVVMLPLDRTTPFGYAGIAQDEVIQGENQRQVLNTLKDWDLWGPLIICLCLSVLLSIKAPKSQASAVFAAVFIAVWAGSAVVTINAQLLGGTISFFQSVCVLGYCVYPMTVAAFIIGVLSYTPWFSAMWLDMIWIAIGFVWATRASSVFIGQYIPRERRALAVYPVFFFYTFLGWMILLF